MKNFRNILMTAALVITGILMSCGGGKGGGLTQGQQLIAALEDQTWTVNATATNVENVEGAPNKSSFNVTFTGNADDTSVSFTLGGDISDYMTGGSFDVSTSGTISNPALTTDNTDLSIGTPTFTITDTKVTIVVEVSAAARSTGVGTWTVVFDA